MRLCAMISGAFAMRGGESRTLTNLARAVHSLDPPRTECLHATPHADVAHSEHSHCRQDVPTLWRWSDENGSADHARAQVRRLRCGSSEAWTAPDAAPWCASGEGLVGWPCAASCRACWRRGKMI
jgi:hypothetical protein